jgi:CBS-domain-containing membrane protein
MLVTDVMTRQPVSITSDWRVKQAAILAAERQVSSLPVVDGRGRICGIVSDADLIRDAFAPDSRANERSHEDAGCTPALLVSDVMTSPAVTVTEGAHLAEVVALMTSTSLKSLPVVDEVGRVVGMIGRSDVVRVRARADDAVRQDVGGLPLSLEHPDWLVDVHDGVVDIDVPQTPLDRSIAEDTGNTGAGVMGVCVH